MTIATINGTPCLRVETRMSRVGCWFADVIVDQATQLSGKVTLSLADGALQLVGTVAPNRTGVYAESAHLRVLGGAGGMATVVSPKWYRSATAKIVVLDLLAAAGETLSATADAQLLAQQLPGYTHKRMPAADALDFLADRLGAIWRVLPDGTVWLGKESWPAAADPGDLLWESPERQQSRYGTEAPAILPGTSLNGRYLSMVSHVVSAKEVSTTVSWETAPNDLDRAARAEKAIFDHFAARFEWLGTFAASVVKQNSDGTLELQLDDSDMPGLTQVPIAFGLPGVTARVPAKARCRVQFAGGDPGLPEVTSFERGTPMELEVDATTSLTLSAGTGGAINVNVGAGGTISLGGSLKAVAMFGDTAGPYPIACQGLIVKGG
jgi:hypothetical protein